MSQFSHYEPCPKCRSIGRDNRGDNFAVYRDGSKHCFSCGNHYFSTFNYWKNRSLTDINDVTKSLLPADWTREVPANAWKWLLQYGLPYSYWQPFCGYSPADKRLIFTVGTPVAFSIGRFIGDDGDGGKGSATHPVEGTHETGSRVDARSGLRHLVSRETGATSGQRQTSGSEHSGEVQHPVGASDSPWPALRGLQVVAGDQRGVGAASAKPKSAPRKWHVWGDAHKHAELVRPKEPSDGERNFVVVVEDIVSGHKVGQVHECMPIFGTRLYNPHIYYLINENKPVVLWLDKDQELRVKKQALQLESVIGQPVRVVTTDKDPKELSYEQIKEVIYG